jgi:hypothetical protein
MGRTSLVPKIQALEGKKWGQKVGKLLLPYIIRAAQNKSTITYGECRDIVVRLKGVSVAGKVSRHYGFPAGWIGNACEEWAKKSQKRIPPLNAIIVNQNTRLPSDGVNGYIRRYLVVRRVPDHTDLGSVINDVLEFGCWGELLQLTGLEAAKTKTEQISGTWNFRPPYEGGSESAAHIALKTAAAKTPTAFRAGQEIGVLERSLPSGDRLDVFFETCRVSVEVKPLYSSAEDIRRGLWQVAKYRFLLNKMADVSKTPKPEARCYLVLGGRLPDALKSEAMALGVDVMENQSIDRHGRLSGK